MKTKTINEKKYVEYEEYKKLKNRTIINSIFLILLFLAIIGLFIAIKVVIDNKEMLQEQPINYIMEKYDFTSCSCVDSEGVVFREGLEFIEVSEVVG